MDAIGWPTQTAQQPAGGNMKSAVSFSGPASPASRENNAAPVHRTRRASSASSARVASRANRTQRKQTRRLSNRAAFIATWWAAQPYPRAEYFSPLTLQMLLGQPMRRMAAALRLLGWRRIIRRNYDKQIPLWLWLPPLSQLKARPRGRPRT